MNDKKTKQNVRKLGVAERYNACPYCGGEVYIYVDDQGEYCVGCVNFDENNTSTYLTYFPEKDEIDTCRKCWNTWATGTAYSSRALDRLNVHDGDYILTDESDGFIVFAGGAGRMFDFLRTKYRLIDPEIYVIHYVQNCRLYNIGTSSLVELVWEYTKPKY